LRDRVIVVFGKLGDDIPGVEEARDEAQHAETDVDETVCGTDAGLDPDSDGGKEDGDEAKEEIA